MIQFDYLPSILLTDILCCVCTLLQTDDEHGTDGNNIETVISQVGALYIYIYIYYRFMVCFPIGLDFLFITFLLHFFMSWTSSLLISSSAIFASTLSNHVLLGLPTGILPSILLNSIHFFTQSSSLLLITCSYYLSLSLLMTVVIGSTPTSLLNSSFVFLSFMEIPHIHLIICIKSIKVPVVEVA